MLPILVDKMKEGNVYLTPVSVLVLLLFTIYYRFQLVDLQRNNQQQQNLILHLNDSLNNMHKQQLQLEKGYKEQYQQLLNIAKNQLKTIKQQFGSVQHLHNLHSNRYLQPKSTQGLTPQQRINRIENIVDEQKQVLSYVEDLLKDQVRQLKFSKIDALANDSYFQAESMKSNWQLLKANIQLPFTTQQQLSHLDKYSKKEQVRLQEAYNISQYPKELPFCIIVPSYNNVRNFRYQYNLQSILNQNYTNFHVIIIDDASPDQTGWHIQRYLDKHNISSDKVTLIRNKKQMTAVPNLHLAATKYCKQNQIGFFVDGDDQLVGNQAFKIFNAVYQAKNPAIAYSVAFEWWALDNLVKDNWSQQYTQIEKKNNQYRETPQKISHLRSFRIDLYRKIKEKDLKFPNGEWFSSTYDEVICLPMMEMSCGNIELIHEYLYLYVYGTGYNDREVDEDWQKRIARTVKFSYKKYQCDPQFMADSLAKRAII